MKKRTILSLIFPILLVASLAFAQESDVNFNAAEAESMVFLFNQTTIKGSDVEVVAPLAQKLNAALEIAKVTEDKTQLVPLKLTAQEIEICFNVINNATFEARYAQLVFSMKNKLQKHMTVKVTVPQQ
ncbi:hypothetical protein JW992_02075 [candidate division KSB1 bacterium]|nr:hypothetical protein [candidate division KSB1 bacterium]